MPINPKTAALATQLFSNSHDPLLAIAVELERAALADEWFARHRLFPNVEFYSGLALRAIGIPVSMYTGARSTLGDDVMIGAAAAAIFRWQRLGCAFER